VSKATTNIANNICHPKIFKIKNEGRGNMFHSKLNSLDALLGSDDFTSK
jgi:hypothetical protein